MASFKRFNLFKKIHEDPIEVFFQSYVEQYSFKTSIVVTFTTHSRTHPHTRPCWLTHPHTLFLNSFLFLPFSHTLPPLKNILWNINKREPRSLDYLWKRNGLFWFECSLIRDRVELRLGDHPTRKKKKLILGLRRFSTRPERTLGLFSHLTHSIYIKYDWMRGITCHVKIFYAVFSRLMVNLEVSLAA